MRIQAKKSLGQNFLSNPRVLDKIVEAAEITKNDTVLEIGPGTGNLTAKLAEKAGRVIAVEKDHRLIDLLKSNFDRFGNVEIVEADVLKLDITRTVLTIQGRSLYGKTPLQYKIVGNIPYYITSHLLRTIFESWPMPKLIVLTIQKEVAQRIMAKPPHMNLLALSVQLYSEPKIVGYISKGNFRPIPKVDSAILKLVSKAELLKSGLNSSVTRQFFELVRLGFSSKRKKLISNLAQKFDKVILEKAFNQLGLKETSRAEELSLDDWLRLVKNLI